MQEPIKTKSRVARAVVLSPSTRLCGCRSTHTTLGPAASSRGWRRSLDLQDYDTMRGCQHTSTTRSELFSCSGSRKPPYALFATRLLSCLYLQYCTCRGCGVSERRFARTSVKKACSMERCTHCRQRDLHQLAFAYRWEPAIPPSGIGAFGPLSIIARNYRLDLFG